MQIFLPFPSIDKSVKCLDWKRLGKQRMETKMVIDIVLDRYEKKSGWRNSAVVKMWAPYSELLKFYFNKVVAEWIARGYVNNMKLEDVDESKIVFPPWWGDEELHSTHRANLLRKDPEYYGKFDWTDTPRNGYLWIIGDERKLFDHDEEKKKKEERAAKRLAAKLEKEKAGKTPKKKRKT